MQTNGLEKAQTRHCPAKTKFVAARNAQPIRITSSPFWKQFLLHAPNWRAPWFRCSSIGWLERQGTASTTAGVPKPSAAVALHVHVNCAEKNTSPRSGSRRSSFGSNQGMAGTERTNKHLLDRRFSTSLRLW